MHGLGPIFLAAAAATQPVVAQEQTGPADTSEPAVQEAGVETIIVTATRSRQNLQDVGIAVSAFSEDTLRNLGVSNTEELTSITPGLQLSVGGGAPLIGLLSIRGVSQNDFAGHIEAPNAFYVDDVYQPSISTSVQQLFDVDRVEVLKGPQGTLFGRNATGGLVHILTKRPGKDFEGFAQASVGNYSERRFEAGVTLPVGDVASTRFSFLRDKRKGFFKNAVGPRLNEDHVVAGRAQLRLDPTSDLDILISANLYEIKPVRTGASFATAGFPDASGLGQPLPPGTPTGLGYVDADGKVFTGAFDEFGLLERKQKDISAKVNYEAGPLTLTSLTSYSDLFNNYREDNDLSSLPATVFFQRANADYFTQEFRLSKNKGSLRWTTGLYYLSIDGRYRQAFDVQLFATMLDANYSQGTKSYSVFGQGEFDLGEQLTLIAGARYTRDRKQYEYVNRCSGPACGAFILSNTIGGAGRYSDRHHEGGLSARLQVNYEPTKDLLFYVSYNRGYKAFNYNAGFAGQAPLDLARFDGEKLDAFEVGIKSEFLDRRVRFNAAAFYYDYKDYQAFDQRGLNFTLFNTDARNYGADAELTISPGGGLSLLAGVALLNTRVKGVPLATGPVSREAPQSPSYTLNLAANQEFNLSFARVRLSANANYTDDFYSQLTNAPVTLIPSNWLVNGRISFADAQERYELSLFAKNLLNEERQIYAFDITGPPFGLVEKNYGPPRQYGVELRLNF